VRAGTAESLLKADFGKPPHALIVPGRLHFMEADALVASPGRTRSSSGGTSEAWPQLRGGRRARSSAGTSRHDRVFAAMEQRPGRRELLKRMDENISLSKIYLSYSKYYL
jgi:hypothetical protein